MSIFKRKIPQMSTDGIDEDDDIDPQLRLRTVRTAASAIAESIRSERRISQRKSRFATRKFFRPKSIEKRRMSSTTENGGGDSRTSTPATISGRRRNIYINTSLPLDELDSHGEPLARYVRNKVRTTKYTILTFLPKNLYEQFRRIANLYFLALVIISLFSVFGAASPQTSALPLLFILCVTAIKDGIEDYRRGVQDEQVNRSVVTKLGNWKNVNIPHDPRSWFEKLLRINPPGRVTKGVQKLRHRDAQEMGEIVLRRPGDDEEDKALDTSLDLSVQIHVQDASESTLTLAAPYQNGKLRPEPSTSSLPSVRYPPPPPPPLTLDASLQRPPRYLETDPSASRPAFGVNEVYSDDPLASRSAFSTKKSGYSASVRSRKSFGVVDLNRHAGGSARWERTLWKKLEIGDIILLRDNDQIPADVVVLSTSDPDGMCFVETKNLDGETNLKPRKSLRCTSSIRSEEDVEQASFVLDSEPPHLNLYLYNGVVRYRGSNNEEKAEPVTINEMLLRGCAVRNTDWIIALVVFTGSDTKIMLNGGSTPSKRSKIEKETNFNVIMNFIVLMLMCLVTAIVNGYFIGLGDTSRDFFEVGSEPSTSAAVDAIITFASSLIAYQNIVPISLYISIEIVKTIQAYFISQDVDMYYAPYDTACVPKSWNISDDLGQIEYVFSDKTGTLTQNVMEFQKCSIRGVAYGDGITEAQRGAKLQSGNADSVDPQETVDKLRKLKEDMLQKMTASYNNRWLQPEKLTFISPQIVDDMTDYKSEQRGHIIAFFRAFAICHSVLADKPDSEKGPYYVDYKAESPDEAALVAAARDVGFPFVGKTNNSFDIEVMGVLETYKPLKVLEFNSTRKRMSVIVRNPEGQIVLYTKGADSVIYERLAANHDEELKRNTQKDTEDFANGGLRTLCIAYRHLSEEEYLDWSRMYDAAASSINERDEQIEKAQEQIEHSLHILGVTALEDKLQEGVPEAIETLHKAGIKLWILTGDKLQTAIEIGYSCNLLKSDMEVMIISAADAIEARTKIEAGLNKIASVLGPPTWNNKNRGFVPGAQASFAVVIDGATLNFALSEELKPLFLDLATQCETVVCCRVSPAQKALTVKLVKEGRNAMTLSIGDGANDVAMIQEANVGCGLFGLEGSQAALSADYAFGQFRFLTKLLIVHGRWSYMRIADMHGNFFYKNVIWTFATFWYLFWNSFDGTYLYEYTFILLYNVVFTSLPVIALGAFDQDLNAKAVLAFPQLYIRGIRGLEYTRTKFWLYMADGLYQSVVVYFIAYLVWALGLALSWNGKTIESLSDFGTTVSVSAIFAANCFVGMNTRYWTVITWVIVFGSSLAMVIWIAIYSAFVSPDFINESTILYGSMTFWATVAISVAVALAPRFICKFIASVYRPRDSDIVREMWVKGDLKDRLGIKHRKEKKITEKFSNIEAAPMYHLPHQRSASEASYAQGAYQATYTGSPEGIEIYTPPPVHSPIRETPNRSRIYRSNAPPSETAIHLSPVSPQPSYYSASDIGPSPLTERSQRPVEPVMSSVSLSPLSTAGAHTLPNVQVHSPDGTSRPGSISNAYEMQTHNSGRAAATPLSERTPSRGTVATSLSFYATASEYEDDQATLGERSPIEYDDSAPRAF